VIIDREEGSYDRGNSGLLMFRTEELPSDKKGGKAKILFIWIVLNQMVRSFDGLQEGPS
jgi:hypothetical protein